MQEFYLKKKKTTKICLGLQSYLKQNFIALQNKCICVQGKHPDTV